MVMIPNLDEYNQIDELLHVVCQILAKLNIEFLPHLDDDSHTNLYFDALGEQITGRWIHLDKGAFLPVVNLNPLEFKILDNSYKTIYTTDIARYTISEIENNIANSLPTIQLHSNPFSRELHYQTPIYSFSSNPLLEPKPSALLMWQHYRQLANTSCELLLGHFQLKGEVRIWPHHFDTGIYVETNTIGIGFGLSMQDPTVKAPYFYMAGYPKNGTIKFNNLPKDNNYKWIISEQWNGAVLPLSQIHHKSKSEQLDLVKHYIKSTLNWYLKTN